MAITVTVVNAADVVPGTNARTDAVFWLLIVGLETESAPPQIKRP